MKKHQQQAYALARIALGINFSLHGLVRLPKLATFSNGIAAQFSNTLLPALLTRSFGYLLPFAEAVIGLLLLAGLFTRQALVAAGMVMGLLLFGTCLKENWDIAGMQMIYALYIAALLFLLEYNCLALDRQR